MVIKGDKFQRKTVALTPSVSLLFCSLCELPFHVTGSNVFSVPAATAQRKKKDFFGTVIPAGLTKGSVKLFSLSPRKLVSFLCAEKLLYKARYRARFAPGQCPINLRIPSTSLFSDVLGSRKPHRPIEHAECFSTTRR